MNTTTQPILDERYANGITFEIIGFQDQKFSDLNIFDQGTSVALATSLFIKHLSNAGELKFDILNRGHYFLATLFFPIPLPIGGMRNLEQFAERASNKLKSDTGFLVENMHYIIDLSSSESRRVSNKYILPTNYLLNMLGIEQCYTPHAEIAADNLVDYFANYKGDMLREKVVERLGDKYELTFHPNLLTDIKRPEFISEFSFSTFQILVSLHGNTVSSILSSLSKTIQINHSCEIDNCLLITCDNQESYYMERTKDFEDGIDMIKNKVENEIIPLGVNILKISLYMEVCLDTPPNYINVIPVFKNQF
ncbi:hypothetical protein [Paenibacillus sp. 2KB_22]|uniref:hypothetical protein n=1 Tax=Paenibacillus sp. 2KB_22 TaxID=3232978 RepID=UPI003F9CBDA6